MAKRKPLEWAATGSARGFDVPENVKPLIERRVANTLLGMLSGRLTIQQAIALAYVQGIKDVAQALGEK